MAEDGAADFDFGVGEGGGDFFAVAFFGGFGFFGGGVEDVAAAFVVGGGRSGGLLGGLLRRLGLPPVPRPDAGGLPSLPGGTPDGSQEVLDYLLGS